MKVNVLGEDAILLWESTKFFWGKTVVMRGNSLSGKRNIFESKYFVGKQFLCETIFLTKCKVYYENAIFLWANVLWEHAKIFLGKHKNIASKWNILLANNTFAREQILQNFSRECNIFKQPCDNAYFYIIELIKFFKYEWGSMSCNSLFICNFTGKLISFTRQWFRIIFFRIIFIKKQAWRSIPKQ